MTQPAAATTQATAAPEKPAAEGDQVAVMMAADAASRALGIRVVDHGSGWATTEMQIREDMVNGYGIAHGGLIFSVADTAFACACNSWAGVSVAPSRKHFE